DSITTSLKSAHEQMLFLMSLINDLALLSRADAGHSALLIEEVNIRDLLAELNKDYQPQATKKGLTIEVKIESASEKLYSSKLYIREILQNFITNAIKYTEKGGVVITAKADAASTTIEVADTGIGIDQAEMAKLFSKFFRSEDYRVRQINGTGLGLY